MSKCACGTVFANHDWWIKHVESLPVADWPKHGEFLDAGQSVGVPVRMMPSKATTPTVVNRCRKCGTAITHVGYCSRTCAATPAEEVRKEEIMQRMFGFYPDVKPIKVKRPSVDTGEV